MANRPDRPRIRLVEREVEEEVQKSLKLGCMFSVFGFLAILALLFHGPFAHLSREQKTLFFLCSIVVLIGVPIVIAKRRAKTATDEIRREVAAERERRAAPTPVEADPLASARAYDPFADPGILDFFRSYERVLAEEFGEEPPPDEKNKLIQTARRYRTCWQHAFHLNHWPDETPAVRFCSRLGGQPDLPIDQAWPRNPEGARLAFIAQVNCGALGPNDITGLLPRKGMLYFFYDLSAPVVPERTEPPAAGVVRRWKVLHSEVPELCPEPDAWPEDLPETARLTRCDLQAVAYATLASPESVTFRSCQPTRDDQSAFDALHNITIHHLQDVKPPYHQVLGHPRALQGEMDVECGRASGLQGEWQLLLQVDSDVRADMQWGDAGRLFFWIRKTDLLQGNFGDVWVMLQSG